MVYFSFTRKGNTVTTFKKKENYIITARMKGSNDVSVPTSKSFDATTLLGIFIDLGLITILAIDGAGTGAWNKFDQNSFVVDPQCPKTITLSMPYDPDFYSGSWSWLMPNNSN